MEDEVALGVVQEHAHVEQPVVERRLGRDREAGAHVRAVGDRHQERPRLDRPLAVELDRHARWSVAECGDDRPEDRRVVALVHLGQLPGDRGVEPDRARLEEDQVADLARRRSRARVLLEGPAPPRPGREARPSIRGMFMTLPSGRMPSAVPVPISSRPNDRRCSRRRRRRRPTSYPALDRVPRRVDGFFLGARLDQLLAQAVAGHQLEEHLARRSIRRDAALASGRRVPDDADAPRLAVRAVPRSLEDAPGLESPIRHDQRRQIARAQQVRRRHVGRPVVPEVDPARAHGRDDGRQCRPRRLVAGSGGRMRMFATIASHP